MQTNISVQTVQTNCGGEVGGEICKSRGEVGGGICKSVITYTFANPPSHLSSAVGLHSLHGEVGLHLIRCLHWQHPKVPRTGLLYHSCRRKSCIASVSSIYIYLLKMLYIYDLLLEGKRTLHINIRKEYCPRIQAMSLCCCASWRVS